MEGAEWHRDRLIVVVVVLLGLVRLGDVQRPRPRRNRTQEAWSEIDVELKRRHDLIPNLVSTVEGYATHEKCTFEAVTQARATAVAAGATGDPTKVAAAENALSGTLRSLFAVAENYPQLRAVESFTQLQETLTGDRGQDRVRAALLQHERARLQHRPPDASHATSSPGCSTSPPSASSRRTRRTAPCPPVSFPGSARRAPPAGWAATRDARRGAAAASGGRGHRPPAEAPARRRHPQLDHTVPGQPAGRGDLGPQTVWPETIFSSTAMRSSIGGCVS